MRENSEERVVDLVGRAQGQLRQRGEFLVFGKLRLELNLLAVQFALFVEPAE